MSWLRLPLLILCLWGDLPGQSHGGEYFDFYWFNKEFDHLVKVHHCEVISQAAYDAPFYELLTDEVFVAWCREPPPVPPISEYSVTLFHLMVLTRESTHPWARCPKFIRFDHITRPTYLWMERPTQIRGKTLSFHDLVYHEEDSWN